MIPRRKKSSARRPRGRTSKSSTFDSNSPINRNVAVADAAASAAAEAAFVEDAAAAKVEARGAVAVVAAATAFAVKSAEWADAVAADAAAVLARMPSWSSTTPGNSLRWAVHPRRLRLRPKICVADEIRQRHLVQSTQSRSSSTFLYTI